jgi:hypothetical protein
MTDREAYRAHLIETRDRLRREALAIDRELGALEREDRKVQELRPGFNEHVEAARFYADSGVKLGQD